LLVSFTLTPMMAARLMNRRGDTHGDAASRTGFYRWIDQFYTWVLAGALRNRILVACLAVAVILSSVPLYRTVRQDFLPSDVDEGEFDVSLTGPQSANLAVMDAAMRDVEKEMMATRGVRVIQTIGGSVFLGNVNQGAAYVRIA